MLLVIGLLFIGIFAGEAIYNKITNIEGETLDSAEAGSGLEEGTSGSGPDEVVVNIEFYLDGPRDSGIFLGETLPDKEREDVKNTYGEGFSNAGFEFTLELKGHNLKPGIHALFIYAITEEETTGYIVKKLIVKGEDSSQGNDLKRPGIGA